MTGAGKGKPGGGGAGYTGPGDSSVIGVAVAWWATFSCYNAAYSGNVMDVVDVATGNTTGSRVTCSGGTAAAIGGTSCTFATNGGNVCSPLATTCPSLGSCFVLKMYDQTGGNACSGASCDLIGGMANPPLLKLSALSAFPCIASSSATVVLNAVNNVTQAQPFTLAMLSERVSGTADLYSVMRDTSGTAGTIRFGYTVSANTADMYNGNSIPAGATASDGHYHALVGVYANATQSVLYVDGTGTNISLGGSTGYPGTSEFALMDAASNSEAILACEAGVWNGDIGATKAANYSTNVVARYGTLP